MVRSAVCSIARCDLLDTFVGFFPFRGVKVAFNTRLKKKHLMEEGGKISARLAQPQVSQSFAYVLLSVTSLSQTDWDFIHPFFRQ